MAEPSHPTRVSLAEAYLQVHDTANARVQAQKALSMDGTSEPAAALLRRIDGGHQ